jgi:hypothetical protein
MNTMRLYLVFAITALLSLNFVATSADDLYAQTNNEEGDVVYGSSSGNIVTLPSQAADDLYAQTNNADATDTDFVPIINADATDTDFVPISDANPCDGKQCGDMCLLEGDMAGQCNSNGDCSFDYGNLGCDTSDISDIGNGPQCDAAASGFSSGMDDQGGLVVWCMDDKPWCAGSNPTSRTSNIKNILLRRDQVDLTLLQSDQTYFTNDGFKFTITESGVSIESQPDYVLITSGNQRCTADGLRLITDADECETAGIKLHDQGIISWRIVDGVELPMVFQTHANANGQFPAGSCKETSWGMHLKLFGGDRPTAGTPGAYPSICATEPGPSAHINWCCDCQ